MGRIKKNSIGMPKAKKKKVKLEENAEMMPDIEEKAAAARSPGRRQPGQPVQPASPGKKLLSDASKRVSVVSRAFVRAGKAFLKAEKLWEEQQALFDRTIAASVRLAQKKRGWAWVDQAHRECKLQDTRHEQHCAFSAVMGATWQAQTALWEAEKARFEQRVASLERKLRRARRR